MLAKSSLWLCLSLFCNAAFAQRYDSAIRKKRIPVTDTMQVDTLSIIPLSLYIYDQKGFRIPDSAFYFDAAKARLHLRSKNTDSIDLYYKVFPYSFAKVYQHKDYTTLARKSSGLYNPYAYYSQNGPNEPFKLEGLSKSGSISRGISFGNRQDVILNSSLNLQLSGKLKNDVEINASITDDNVPFQPDGNTQQIQDFDKVFIQFSRFDDQLIVGDFEIRRPNSYFMNYFKRAQGISSTIRFPLSKKDTSGHMKISASGAIARGRFARNLFNGEEGNQGPYRLQGNNNEGLIIVLSGSERVYLNGQLLKRGQDNDYIIDYNTAELSFMPKRLITKDVRIIVEFEYSDKNYTRTLYAVQDEYTSKKANIRFNYYSEQDLKNQPVLQSLSDKDKTVLALAGDSLNKAIASTADSVAFNPDEVLYKKIDTLLSPVPIYVYSTNKDSAHFRLSFSNVGLGKGNYVLTQSTANGRVFKWVAPLSGVPQGSYEPVTLLISPKKRQMLTLGGDYILNATTKLNTEIALSNSDDNLFSDLGNDDNTGLALRSVLDKRIPTHDSLWSLNTQVSYETVQKNFRQIEQFRSSEFQRDWNIATIPNSKNEHLSGVAFDIHRLHFGQLNYQAKTYIREHSYTGFLQSLRTNTTYKKYTLSGSGSYLSADNEGTKSHFFREKADLNKVIGAFVLGVNTDQEINSFQKQGADTLEQQSYSFFQWETYITYSNANRIAKNPEKPRRPASMRLDYSERTDNVGRQESLKLASKAKNTSFTTHLPTFANGNLNTVTTYRELEIFRQDYIVKEPENTLLNRIEYNFSLLKNLLTSNTFLQAGTGREMRKDYAFQEVAAGKGQFIRIDYNKNGVFEKNEYEIAVYADSARFVKVFLPTNEYIKAFTNDFNQQLSLNLNSYFSQKKGFIRNLGRFSDQFSYQSSRKTQKSNALTTIAYLSPFGISTKDTSVLSNQGTVRNTFFYNQSKSAFGVDYTTQNSHLKSFLTSGFEYRSSREHSLRIRAMFLRDYQLILIAKEARKENNAELFPNRNYAISIFDMEPHLIYQPSSTFRIQLNGRYGEKANELGKHEFAVVQKIGIESKYALQKGGNVQAQLNLIKFNYTGEENTPVSYEILEGLKGGQNITWNVGIQKTLSNNTQLTVNYDGRKSEGAKTIHTGGVQLRAFF